MNGIIQRIITVETEYQRLATEATVASVAISCPPTNSGSVYFLGDDGGDVPWIPGEWHDFKSIDLAQVLVKGTYGDKVTIVGGTW